MKKYFVIVFIGLTTVMFSNKLSAQKSRWSLGFNAGHVTGVGPAFKYTNNNWAAQLSFMPLVRDKDTDFNVRTSIALFYRISDGDRIDLYLYQANQHRYLSQYLVSDCYLGCSGYHQKAHYYDTSLGFGFEYEFTKNIALTIMTGYTAMENFTKASIGLESSLMYKF